MKSNFKTTLRREAAFSLNTQPLWLRLLKYGALTTLIYFFHGSKTFWILFGVGCVLAVLMHFWYRSKTAGWTKSYGGWKHQKSKLDK